jgi:hypothetical protein
MEGGDQAMDESTQPVLDSSPEKKSFLKKLGNFLMYGGWMLVIVLGLVLMILFSHK